MKLIHYATTKNRSRRRGSFFLFIIVALTILRENTVQVRGYATATRLPLITESRHQHQYRLSLSPHKKQQLLVPHNNGGNTHALSIRGGAVGNRGVTRLNFANQAFASVLAGSIAGAIGVGVAFPLDTLKTKSQVLSRQRQMDTGGTGSVESYGMFTLIPMIYKMEGIAGFYGGVRGMMAGQAIIKSVAFSVNAIALDFLRDISPALTSVTTLLLAACFSGFVTSFLVTPIERIKVMMQASNSDEDGTPTYSNEFKCAKVVLKNEGWIGLMGRGLGPTLVREIPSYGLYFLLYGILSTLPSAASMGKIAPLVNGALSGMGSWIPVYPIDVVKTLVQNSDGSQAGGDEVGSLNAIDVARDLYADGGITAFFDGLTPKMLRAAVNHAVTFFIYDIIMTALG